MNCRHCHTPLTHVFADLGTAPPSNAYLSGTDLAGPEIFYPLRVLVCDRCWLVQTEDYAAAADLFAPDYAYFSSTSTTWVAHAASYAAAITDRLSLGDASFVLEVASNDGYLLRHFKARGIPCLGIEPTASTAAAAESLGIPVLREFFGEALGRSLAAEGRQADLIIGNNVFAHVPDINDFCLGLKAALGEAGTITLEFPHLMKLIGDCQFDTIYHEHFSYFSLHSAARVLESAQLRVFDVEELPTHGGSLRLYVCHADDPRSPSAVVDELLVRELDFGITSAETYLRFQERVDAVKNRFLAYLIEQKQKGRSIAAYGAAAKGNTLLNYAGIRRELIPFVCDAAPSKQGRFLPGSRIPILSPEEMRRRKPELVVILPWNISSEIKRQLAFLREEAGTEFITAIPSLEVT